MGATWQIRLKRCSAAAMQDVAVITLVAGTGSPGCRGPFRPSYL